MDKPCCNKTALFRAVRAVPDEASAAALLENVALRPGVTPKAAAKMIRGVAVDETKPPSDEDISEFLNIFADFKIEKGEWIRLFGLVRRNWGWIVATVGLVVTTLGGWWYSQQPAEDHEPGAIVEAIKELGKEQAAGFKSVLDAVKVAPPKPEPLPPPKPVPVPTDAIQVETQVEAHVGKPVKLPIKAPAALTFTTLPPERAGEVDADDQFVRITAQSDGQFWVVTSCVVNNKVAVKVIEVKAGKGPMPPPEPPIPPKPPEPKPSDAVLGDGFRAMIVLESADTSLPAKQFSAIYGKETAAVLAKTVPTKDGGKRGWYITDKDQDFSMESKVWQDALKRPRQSLPWLIVSSPGKGSFEGPVPGDPAAMTSILNKYLP